jgi:hypothetical protein
MHPGKSTSSTNKLRNYKEVKTMAKKCKLIRINDGTAKTLENGNFHFVEEMEWAAKYLERYLNEGYEVKHMVPEVTPAIQKDGTYSFYKGGFTFYLEREVADDSFSHHEAEAEGPDDIPLDIDEDITDYLIPNIDYDEDEFDEDEFDEE